MKELHEEEITTQYRIVCSKCLQWMEPGTEAFWYKKDALVRHADERVCAGEQEKKTMKRVVIESPLNASTDEGVARNIRYAKLCMLDSLRRGEAPFASHLLYTQALNDRVPEERELGMTAGFAWNTAAEVAAVYIDLGISPGMQRGIDDHKARGTEVHIRHLSESLLAEFGSVE